MSHNDSEAVSSTECPTCGRTFETRQGLGQHHSRTHGETLAEYKRRQNGGVDCPTCGETYKNEHGMRIHHAKAHGKSVAPPATDGDVVCPWEGCDRRFKNRRGVSIHHKRAHGESIAGVKVECSWCGESAGRREPGHVESHEHFYCSHRCQSMFVSAGKSHDKLSEEEVPQTKAECAVCGDEVNRIPAHFARVERTFCSAECRSQWRSEYYSGDGHPRWKGGMASYYGWNWSRQRKRALKRDSHECAVCGMSHDDHVDEYDNGLHVHHKTPLQSFRDGETFDYETANALDNLVTLCQKHHAVADRVAPLYPFAD